MGDTEIFQKIKEILVKQLFVDEELVVPEARLIDDLGADSIDKIEIKMSLEDVFCIGIPEESGRLDGSITVQGVFDYVQQLLDEKAECERQNPAYAI